MWLYLPMTQARLDQAMPEYRSRLAAMQKSFPLRKLVPEFCLTSKRYMLIDLSQFLESLRPDEEQVAEEFIGRPVRKAVITVPAYFNDSQRQVKPILPSFQRSICS